MIVLTGCNSPSKQVASLVDAAAKESGTGDVSSAEVQQLCAQQCAVTGQISCPDQADCLSRCESVLSLPDCAAQTRALANCVIAGGADIITCDPGAHVTVFKPGYCTDEQAALLACGRGL